LGFEWTRRQGGGVIKHRDRGCKWGRAHKEGGAKTTDKPLNKHPIRESMPPSKGSWDTVNKRNECESRSQW